MSKIDFTDELKNFVKERGEVTYEEVKIFTENKKHKVETATRYLRHFKNISPIKNGKRHITGYKIEESDYDFYKRK